MKKARVILLALLLGLLANVALSACQAQEPTVPEVVEREVEVVVTRVVTETITEEGEEVEVTRVITEEVVVTATPPGIPQGGVIEIPIQTQPLSLNPVLALELSAGTVNNMLFASLTAVDPETFEVVPYLATSWENSEDLMTWTFHLAENATWHDGMPITAEDVQWTFERILNPEEGAVRRSVVANDLESVEVIDEHTVQFNLINPNALFPDLLSVGSLEPLPKHILEGFALLVDATEFNTQMPIGSGPFKMVQAVTGSHFELEAFEEFFLGAPHLDGVVFKILPNVNAQLAQLKTGELDWIAIEPLNVGTVLADPNLELITTASGRYHMMEWHMGGPLADVYDPVYEDLFFDPRVRLALTHAIDRQSILEHVGLGLGVLGDNLIPPAISWASNPDLEPRAYDPELALELLADAGWTDSDGDGILDKDGLPFHFTLLTDMGNPTREQIGLIFQQSFQAIGMDVEYVIAERGGRFNEEVQAHSAMARLTTRPTLHPDNLRRFYVTGGGSNFNNYSNATVDELLVAATQTADREEQRDLYYQADAALYEDPPIMLIYYPQELLAHNASLQNVPRGEILYSVKFAHEIYMQP